MIYLNDKPITPTMFPDGTSQVWKLDLGDSPRRVVWRFEHEAELFHVMQLLHLLKTRGEAEVFVPYLPYARQDKPVGCNETFALRAFVRAVESFDAHWHLLDPHPSFDSPALRGLSYIRHAIDLGPVTDGMDYGLVILPDHGAASRYAARLDRPAIVGDKVRDPSTGRIVSYSLPAFPVEPTRILVIDDLCDGGATFEALGESILRESIAPADLFVTHGIFSKGLSALLEKFDRIITTDSFHPALRDGDGLKIAAKQNPRFKEFRSAIKSGRLIVYDALEMMGYATSKEVSHVG